MSIKVYVDIKGHRHDDGTVHTQTYVEAIGDNSGETQLAAKTGAIIGGLGTAGMVNAIEKNQTPTLNIDAQYRKQLELDRQ